MNLPEKDIILHTGAGKDLRTVGSIPAQETVFMKVSIITVTLNSATYLEDCIRSVQEQEYKHIEHIIIDGKSTDGTIAIIKKYEDGISAWISETDKGMYDAINKGMQMATGEVIGILNSDDMLDNPQVIFEIVKTFLAQKTDAVYGDLDFVDKVNTNHVLRSWKGKIYNRSRFHLGWMPAHPTFYVKRKMVEKYGGYETHYFTAADYEFMCRYLFQYRLKAAYLPKMIVRMRVGGASNISLKQRLRANRRDYLAMKSNKIPLAFIASILKPLLKIGQFKRTRENGRIRLF
jgi:glycosyltransferase